MNVRDLSHPELMGELAGQGLWLRTGPVVTVIRSRLSTVVRGLALHYADHPIEQADGFADFHVSIGLPRNVRRWLRPQAVFSLDGALPFKPLPADQAFPMLEWGLNWCVSSYCHQYLTIHAAVIERDGNALILPGPSGSGKSTLCAGLVTRGWRLLSDELTLIEPATGLVRPLPRPVSLKNASIGVLRDFSAHALLGPIVTDTTKGAVSHMKPPAESVKRAGEVARPRWIVVPRYQTGEAARLSPLPKAHAFMQLADNAFNYSLHEKRGFDVLARLIDECDCHEFTYSRLDEASAVFERLALGA